MTDDAVSYYTDAELGLVDAEPGWWEWTVEQVSTVYSWTPAAIITGAATEAAARVDWDALASAPLDVVRAAIEAQAAAAGMRAELVQQLIEGAGNSRDALLELLRLIVTEGASAFRTAADQVGQTTRNATWAVVGMNVAVGAVLVAGALGAFWVAGGKLEVAGALAKVLK